MNPREEEIIQKTVDFVKDRLASAESGHDWFHIQRVWKLSKKIASEENCNIFTVSLGALLHDIADNKFHNKGEEYALDIAGNFLKKINVDEDDIRKVLFIIDNISFRKNSSKTEDFPIELKIVQDADRLDAIGAIGIARTFNFGGYKNNVIYDPEIKPNVNQSKEEYKKSKCTTINHFYEKLLLLKHLMHTETAKKIAEERHQFMLQFLEQFYKEWNTS